ncbi:MAG TPA: hypothetical protein V6D06_21175 [Trichocoleus sp.]
MQTTSVPSYLSSAVECPKCGKHSIVSHQTGAYHCLNCGFERILSSPDAENDSEEEGNVFTAAFGVVVFVMTLLLFI